MAEKVQVLSLAGRNDGDPPPVALRDIWDRLHPVLTEMLRFNQSDTAVRAQQLTMVRDGCLEVNSPFHDGADRSHISFSHNYRFFFRFSSLEEYYWVSGLLDRAYCLASIFFPARSTVVHLYPDADPPELYEHFDRLYGDAKRSPSLDRPAPGKGLVISGFQHPIHVLWNELPALAQAAVSPLASAMRVAIRYEPFGPSRELFPELSDNIVRVTHTEVAELNATEPFPVGLGSRVITADLQERVRAAAGRHASAGVTAAREAFRRSHWPILWLSVKPPKRTVAHQVEVLAHLVHSTRNAYPTAGFLIDGATWPWDFEVDGAYPDWFRDVISGAIAGCGELTGQLLAALGPQMAGHVVAVHNISICDEIAWGEAADFYFCHGGTMQNKIGWVHRVPGILHSNSRFMASFRAMLPPVEAGPPCHCLPDDLISDEDLAGYSAVEVARKDMNYAFTSLERTTNTVLSTMQQYLGHKPRPRRAAGPFVSAAIAATDLIHRTFRFSRVDGTMIAVLTLGPAGSLIGYSHPNERCWRIDGGNLVFVGDSGQVTTTFDKTEYNGFRYRFTGRYFASGSAPHHVLEEIASQPVQEGPCDG